MVRMVDIAEQAGVSRATVSAVLNNKDIAAGIPEVTRLRVLSAANQLGYRPNEVARAMVTGKNRVLVYLVHDPSQEVAACILKGALDEAEEHGYLIKLVGREGQFDQRDIERCVELRPAGVMVLYVTPPITEYLQKEMARYQIPVVLLDSGFPFPGVTRVLSDDVDGIWQGAAHLYQLGHRRIAYLSGPSVSAAATLREEGYRAAMARLGLPIRADYIAQTAWQIDAARDATTKFLQLPTTERPTALMCADDKMALVASRTAASLGFRVPRDLSLVGFANLEMASYGSPPLTTIAQPFRGIGASAVRSLLAASQSLEKQEPVKTDDVLLANRLIVRESTAPPASQACLSERSNQ